MINISSFFIAKCDKKIKESIVNRKRWISAWGYEQKVCSPKWIRYITISNKEFWKEIHSMKKVMLEHNYVILLSIMYGSTIFGICMLP